MPLTNQVRLVEAIRADFASLSPSYVQLVVCFGWFEGEFRGPVDGESFRQALQIMGVSDSANTVFKGLSKLHRLSKTLPQFEPQCRELRSFLLEALIDLATQLAHDAEQELSWEMGNTCTHTHKINKFTR